MNLGATRTTATLERNAVPGGAGTADFDARLAAHGVSPLRRASVATLQINVGKRCNLACLHCHVGAGPKRTESMGRRVAERVLELLACNPQVEVLDLTGGAPELNENFRSLVAGARALGRRVIDRCNLTVLFEPGQEDSAEFLAANEVEIVASLPCYSPSNVDRQRGRGVFEASIEALQLLNRMGYGLATSRLHLDLVYNPLGAFLPPPQADLEVQYKSALRQQHGIEFDRLLAITNMPIGRHAHDLERDGKLEEYLSLLVNHFNSATLTGLMCRGVLSISYDGRLYDCDFNQMLEIGLPGRARTIFDLDDLRMLDGQKIATARHCFACTSGAGSSCGGSLT